MAKVIERFSLKKFCKRHTQKQVEYLIEQNFIDDSAYSFITFHSFDFDKINLLKTFLKIITYEIDLIVPKVKESFPVKNK